jgi:hypothetical protein
MKDCTSPSSQAGLRTTRIACAAAVVVTVAATLPGAAHAAHPIPPAVPDNIQVPAGSEAFLVGHAYGTQNYICLPSGSGFAWILFTPQATLFDDRDRQVTTHFFGPNPDENDTIRAVWQHSRDTSSVWGRAIAVSTDANFVEPGAIPWLLIQVVGTENGPTGGDRLSETIFIQRLNTSGGVAPATGCAAATDIGKSAFMPYTADYFFYRQARTHEDD